jgi:hypothetical protein
MIVIEVKNQQKEEIQKVVKFARRDIFTTALFMKATAQRAYFVYVLSTREGPFCAAVLATDYVHTYEPMPWLQLPTSLLEDQRSFSLVVYNTRSAVAEYRGWRRTVHRVPQRVTAVSQAQETLLDTMFATPTMRVMNERWVATYIRYTPVSDSAILSPAGMTVLTETLMITRRMPLPVPAGYIERHLFFIAQPASTITVAHTPSVTWAWASEHVGIGTFATEKRTCTAHKVHTALKAIEATRQPGYDLAISLPALVLLSETTRGVTGDVITLVWHNDQILMKNTEHRTIASFAVGRTTNTPHTLCVHRSFLDAISTLSTDVWNVLHWPAQPKIPIELESAGLRIITPTL